MTNIDYQNGLIPNNHWNKFNFTDSEVGILFGEGHIREDIAFVCLEEISEFADWNSTYKLYFRDLKSKDVYYFCVETSLYDGLEKVKNYFPGTMNRLPIVFEDSSEEDGICASKFEFNRKELSLLIKGDKVEPWSCIKNIVVNVLDDDGLSHYDQAYLYFTLQLDDEYYFRVQIECRPWEEDTEDYVYKVFEPLEKLEHPYNLASLEHYKSQKENLEAQVFELKVKLKLLSERLKEIGSHNLIEIPIIPNDFDNLKLYGFINGEPIHFMTLNKGDKIYKAVK